MAFIVDHVDASGEHQWAVIHCSCDLTAKDDELVIQTVAAVREAYGEDRLLAQAAIPDPDPDVGHLFDLDAIRRAIRRGLPDPEVEKDKIPHLANYRSEAAEMVAKGALVAAYGIAFPVAPQRGKPNANQPILGFDHWGVLSSGTEHTLALVQVKGTHDDKVPPAVAEVLATECKRVPTQVDEICRTLTVLASGLEGHQLQDAIFFMLEEIGNGGLPKLVVAPVVVRGGGTVSHADDLQPCREACGDFAPASGRGATVSIGVSLTDFGRTVMEAARAA